MLMQSQIINVALMKMSYHGSFTISAYVDTNGIPLSHPLFLSSTGIGLNHVPDDMPPKRASAGRRGRATAVKEALRGWGTRRGRSVTMARGQPEPEEAPPAASSVTPPAPEAIALAPPTPQLGTNIG